MAWWNPVSWFAEPILEDAERRANASIATAEATAKALSKSILDDAEARAQRLTQTDSSLSWFGKYFMLLATLGFAALVMLLVFAASRVSPRPPGKETSRTSTLVASRSGGIMGMPARANREVAKLDSIEKLRRYFEPRHDAAP